MSARTASTTSGRVRVSQLRVGDRIRWGSRIARLDRIAPGRTPGHLALTNEYGQHAEVRAAASIERLPQSLTGAA